MSVSNGSYQLVVAINSVIDFQTCG